MTDVVLDNTFQVPANAWKDIIKRGEQTTLIGKKGKYNQY